jgi:hypothetical protein
MDPGACCSLNCTGSVSAKGDGNSQNRRPCLQSRTSVGAGLELPIDHFRLLGVGPTTDAQAVLHALQLRLDRAPDQGFTQETLKAREDLLRSSADLLTDTQRRSDYEADLTSLAASGDSVMPALDVPSSREVGGLLLLLESGQPLECFELASRSLHPPQAPALGSGREADLALLAGLACLAAAADLHRQRHYEQAARVLRRGLQLLQRMGQLPTIRQQISDELHGLRPYRVLDLLSRDLASTQERIEGLALLEELVQEHGGLDGECSTLLPAAEFRAFFRQIRSYLTVQEQVDLYCRWADESPAASLLAATALTASGFAQRKPERIQEALERLQAAGNAGGAPLLAFLQLLLGDVPAALASFGTAADGNPAVLAEPTDDDPLARLCDLCRDWLARDVLPGYRDLEADPDLEAYFADRDVQAWVERHERPRSLASPEAASASGAAEAPSNPFAAWTPRIDFSPAGGTAPAPPPGPADAHLPADEELWDPQSGAEGTRARAWSLPNLPDLALVREQLRADPRRLWIAAAASTVVLLIAAAVALRLGRPAARPLPVQPISQPRPAGPAANPPPPDNQPALPLTAVDPSERELRTLLEAWLATKAAVLAGGQALRPLDSLAGVNLVQRLRQERAEDQASGTTQAISTSLESLVIDESTANRIAASVRLRYSDRRLDGAGQTVGAPSNLQLTNRYVFGRGPDGIWRVAGFRRS